MKTSSSPVDRQAVTVESIARLILKEWTKEDLEFVATGAYDYGMTKRAIRNDYGLWEFDHPLTQHWHMHPECRNIVDGIDHSEHHPDNVSAEILMEVRQLLKDGAYEAPKPEPFLTSIWNWVKP